MPPTVWAVLFLGLHVTSCSQIRGHDSRSRVHEQSKCHHEAFVNPELEAPPSKQPPGIYLTDPHAQLGVARLYYAGEWGVPCNHAEVRLCGCSHCVLQVFVHVNRLFMIALLINIALLTNQQPIRQSLACLARAMCDFVQAFRWVEASALQGNAAAQLSLAAFFFGDTIYLNHRGTTSDGGGHSASPSAKMLAEIDVRLPSIAAALGMPMYGGCSRTTEQTEQEMPPTNETLATEWLHLAARQKHPLACFTLGVLYFTGGAGTVQNDTMAATWFAHASESVNLSSRSVPDKRTPNAADSLAVRNRADFNLALLYAAGRGVAHNLTEALFRYTRSAKSGHTAAQVNLGLLHAVGSVGHYTAIHAGVQARDTANCNDPTTATPPVDAGARSRGCADDSGAAILSEKLWMHQEYMSKDVADGLIRTATDGTFLVRPRGEDHPGQYILSVVYQHAPTQHLITKEAGHVQGTSSAGDKGLDVESTRGSVEKEDGPPAIYHINRQTFGLNAKTVQELIGAFTVAKENLPPGWPVVLSHPIGPDYIPADTATGLRWLREAADGTHARQHQQPTHPQRHQQGYAEDQQYHRGRATYLLGEHHEREAAANADPGRHACDEAASAAERMFCTQRLTVPFYRQSANLGFAAAQFRLGQLTEAGLLGLSQSYDEALIWYTKAAVQGHRVAQYRLGVLFRDGTLPLTSSEHTNNGADEAAHAVGRSGGDSGGGTPVPAHLRGTTGPNPDGGGPGGGGGGGGGATVHDFAAASRWFQAAAVHGHLDAQFELAELFESRSKAAVLAQQSKQQRTMVKGHDDGNVAGNTDETPSNTTHGAGNSTVPLAASTAESDLEVAWKWLVVAGEAGHTQAQLRLGDAFDDAVKPPGTLSSVAKYDPQHAAMWYLRCAEQHNDADAQFNLGHYYQYEQQQQARHALENRTAPAAAAVPTSATMTAGTDIKPDLPADQHLARAVEWYKAAAAQNHSEAQLNLGTMYATGNGVRKDERAAIAYFRRAADSTKVGNSRADFNLGIMYSKPAASDGELNNNSHADGDAGERETHRGSGGDRVKRDLAQALQRYTRAAKKGHAAAQVNLGLLYATGGTDHSDDGGRFVLPADDMAAARWLRAAANQGHARAAYNLGVLYEQGRGVRQDMAVAALWYARAKTFKTKELRGP